MAFARMLKGVSMMLTIGKPIFEVPFLPVCYSLASILKKSKVSMLFHALNTM